MKKWHRSLSSSGTPSFPNVQIRVGVHFIFWRKSPSLAAFNAAAVSEGVASFVSPFRVSYL